MEYLTGANEFLTGCNYWSSEAGIRMWRDWSEEAVEKDFAALKDTGMNTVRLFPLWSDFQPVSWACGFGGSHVELVTSDGLPLPEKGLRHFGLDPVMMTRFRIIADLAVKYDLKLIVGLLTGWMSGALFVPPALAGFGIDFCDLASCDALPGSQFYLVPCITGFIAWQPCWATEMPTTTLDFCSFWDKVSNNPTRKRRSPIL